MFGRPGHFRTVFRSLPSLLYQRTRILQAGSRIFLGSHSCSLVVQVLRCRSNTLACVPRVFVFLHIRSICPRNSIEQGRRNVRVLYGYELPETVVPRSHGGLSQLSVRQCLVGDTTFPCGVAFFIALYVFGCGFVYLSRFRNVSSCPFYGLSIRAMLSCGLAKVPVRLVS